MMARSEHIIALEVLRREDAARVGTKAAGLGEMTGLGLRVPAGFVVTARAQEEFLITTGLDRMIADRADAIAELDWRGEQLAAELRDLIEATPFPPQMEEEILAEHSRLGLTECRLGVAVRSSAAAEDLDEASFAGQLETILGVGPADLLAAVRRCWASAFGSRVLAYRQNVVVAEASFGASVVVQEMLEPRAAGVMFTIDPVKQDPFATVVEASWGLGELLVSGEVAPDRFVVSKLDSTIQTTIGEKHRQFAPGPAGALTVIDVPPDRRGVACLQSSEVRELVDAGERLETHYGGPRDVEWAIVDGPVGADLYMLQVRAVTTQLAEPWGSLSHEDPVDQVIDVMLRSHT